MAYSLDLKKLVNDLRGPKGVSALTEELNKLSSQINKLKEQVKPQAHAKLREAEAKYAVLLKKFHTAQKDLDKEVTKRIAVVKKHAKEVEKNLNQYKRMALAQRSKLQAAFTKKKAGAARTTAKTTSKKAAPTAAHRKARSTARKTSKKATARA
jgi:SMC interacting uncharacterized protein involved in chromosome segregation